MFVLPAQKGRVQSLAFAPDSSTLYAAHECDDVRVWDLAARTARSFFEIGKKRLGGTPSLLPGGRWAYGEVQRHARPPFEVGFVRLRESGLVDLRTGADSPFYFLWQTCGAAVALACSAAIAPDGSRLFTLAPSNRDRAHPLSAEAPGHRLYGWTVADHGPLCAWRQDLPDGTTGKAVAFLGTNRCASVEHTLTGEHSSARIVIRRATNGRVEAQIPYSASYRYIDQLLGSPDGTKLVSRRGSELRVWEASDWAKPPTVVAGKFGFLLDTPAAVFHPLAPYLLLANGGRSIVVYETSTWEPVRKWKWDAGGLLRVITVSPDGTLAAAGGPRGTVVVWDLDL
jgi:WD40 repeat protein